jgi:phage terminase small subunit
MDKELNNSKLTAKQKRFVDEYMLDLNATQQQQIRAGYSKKTAKEIGYENLTKPHIQLEIEKRQQENRDKYNVTIEEVVCRVKEIMLTDEFNPVHNANLKAAEILNKMFGFNNENKDSNSEDVSNLTIKIIRGNGSEGK